MKKAFMDVTFELKFDNEKGSGSHALEERVIWIAETLEREPQDSLWDSQRASKEHGVLK